MRDGKRAVGFNNERGKGDHYQGERLNFETPELFFGRRTERRWSLVSALLGAGELSVPELARRVSRDVKRVHEVVTTLVELGLVERTEGGGVRCPFADIHVDMHIRKPNPVGLKSPQYHSPGRCRP